MSTGQKGASPLAGLLTIVNLHDLKKPEASGGGLLVIVSPGNLIKPNTARVSLLSIVMVQGLPKLCMNLTKPHIMNLSKPDIGIAGMLTNVDIESAEMMTNDDISKPYEHKNAPITREFLGMLGEFKDTLGKFCESIKKGNETSTRAGLFAAVRAREEGFPGVTTRRENHATDWGFETSTRARGDFLESIKKGLQSHCPSIYGYRAPAKSGAGIGLPDMLSATHDAPGVFFCVLNLSHPFSSDAVIIRAAHEIMVGWVVASSEAPVSDNAGKTNSAQSTTSKIGLFGGGIKYQLSEAASWLLPSPKNRLSSGVFIPASNPAISLYRLLLNQRPAPCYQTVHTCLLPAFVQGALMLNHFIVYGYGVNQRGLTIGINHKSRAESRESARAAAMLKAQDSGLSLIRITRIQEVAA